MTRSTKCGRADVPPGSFAPIVCRAFTPPVANSGTESRDGKDWKENCADRSPRVTLARVYTSHHSKFATSLGCGGEDASRLGDEST